MNEQGAVTVPPRWRQTKRALVLLHVFAVLAALAVVAAEAQAGAAPIRIVLNGQPRQLPAAPIVVRGRVLVPIRGTLEAAGARVEWNRSTRMVTAAKQNRRVALVIGTRMARVNRRTVRLDIPPVIHQGRVYVPLRFVSEALGAKVTWDKGQREVSITTTTHAPAQLRQEGLGPGAAHRGR